MTRRDGEHQRRLAVFVALAPFHFSAAAHAFGWVPFRAFLQAETPDATRSFFEKAFLYGLIVVGVISIFVKFIHPETYAWLTLVIFSGLVLIDFARLRAGGDGLGPVLMATSIYLDAINIFLALLQIFGGRRSSD